MMKFPGWTEVTLVQWAPPPTIWVFECGCAVVMKDGQAIPKKNCLQHPGELSAGEADDPQAA